jgi:hypothetical protein
MPLFLLAGHVRSHSSSQLLFSPNATDVTAVAPAAKIKKCCRTGSAASSETGRCGSSLRHQQLCGGPRRGMNRPTIVRAGSGSGTGRIWMAGGRAKAVVGCPCPAGDGDVLHRRSGHGRGVVQPLTDSKPTPTIVSCSSLAS